MDYHNILKMLKEKLKQNRAPADLDAILHSSLKEYCKENGVRINWFIDSAVKEKLSKENK